MALWREGRQRSVNWEEVLTISIPDSYPIGAIFGQQIECVRDSHPHQKVLVQRSTNIRRLHAMLRGGRVEVDQRSRLVKVTGANGSAVIADLTQHFTSHSEIAIGIYPHPAVVKNICVAVSSPDTLMAFSPYNTPGAILAVASRLNEQFYTLEIVDAHTRDISLPNAAPSDTSTSPLIGDSTKRGSLFLATDTVALCEELLQASATARDSTPRFDNLKLRANIGKQFFHANKNRSLRTDPESFKTIQAMNVGFGGDLRGLYSNVLEERHAAAVQRYLTGSLGFELVKEKTSISLHVLDAAHNTSHCIVFNEDSEGRTLGKFKSGTAKMYFLGGVANTTADFRLRLLGYYYFDETSDITVRMSALAKNCEMRDGHMEMPQDLRAAMGFKLDLRRQKTKTKYDGVYQDSRGTKITARVSILRVVSTEFEDRGGRCTHHHEIAIYVPALIRALNAMPSGDSEYSMSDEEQLSQLTAFLELCKDLQSVVYL